MIKTTPFEMVFIIRDKMQEILDQVLLEAYLDQYNIRSLFDTPELIVV